MSYNLHCKDLVNQVRSNIDEGNVTSAKWSDTEIVRAINRAKDYYVNQINKVWPESLLKAGTDITFVNDTELYDVPGDFKAMRRLEIAGTNEKVELIPMDNKEIVRASNDFHDSGPSYYHLGNQIGLVNVSGDVTPYYLRRVPDLHYGTVSAFTSTTLTFDLTPNGSSTGDFTVKRQDDYYNNGAIIDVYSGTGAGQERTITDYAGVTKVATVAAWTTNPDTSSLYALKYDLPLEVDDLIILRATLRILPKERKRDASEIRAQMQQQEREFLTNLNPSRERKFIEYIAD